MTHPARSPILYVALVAGLLLSACGKHADEQAPAATPPAASTAMTPPAPASSAPAPASTAIAPATPTTTAAPASASTTAAATDAFKVDQLQLGDAITSGYKVSKPTTTFAPSQNTIYASVSTTGRTAGSTLSARWSYLENEGQQISTISQTIATDGPATTTFKVRNPNNWPQGKYKVEISLDGKPVTAQTFEVKADATAAS
jgi:hypothetical protein